MLDSVDFQRVTPVKGTDFLVAVMPGMCSPPRRAIADLLRDSGAAEPLTPQPDSKIVPRPDVHVCNVHLSGMQFRRAQPWPLCCPRYFLSSAGHRSHPNGLSQAIDNMGKGGPRCALAWTHGCQ